MAAPITHIVLTDKVFKKYFSNKDRQKFFVGTSLPDIRYLGCIAREKTHYKNVTLKDVLDRNSFDAGMLFHSLVDEVRERYMNKNGYYSLFPKTYRAIQASKMFEDRILYNKVTNWPEIIDYFDKVYKEELDLDIKKDDIEKWHQSRKEYFARKPGDKEIIMFAVKTGFPSELGEEINNIIQNADTKAAKKIVLNFYDSFENHL